MSVIDSIFPLKYKFKYLYVKVYNRIERAVRLQYNIWKYQSYVGITMAVNLLHEENALAGIDISPEGMTAVK